MDLLGRIADLKGIRATDAGLEIGAGVTYAELIASDDVRAKRPILSEPRRGELMTVEVPTHVSASIEFAAGPIATLVTSFDVRCGTPWTSIGSAPITSL